jgi:galactokinase
VRNGLGQSAQTAVSKTCFVLALMQPFSPTIIAHRFEQIFGAAPDLTVNAPGRINLIGEHTDYNGGFVMPAAINKSIVVAISRREDSELHLYSTDFNTHCIINQADRKPSTDWWTYVLGVADQFLTSGHAITGFNLVVGGNVPFGAGLSSSAALESGVALAINSLYELGLNRLELAKLAQKAEQQYAGVQCGIMDMFASLMGKKDAVIQLDCNTLEYHYRPLKLSHHCLVLLNSNVKHQLANSAYNNRRQACEQGVAFISEAEGNGINSLRHATIAQLKTHVLPKDALVYQRCLYVIQENERVLQACAALDDGDLPAFGRAMFASHRGLSLQYEVSCAALDFLVQHMAQSSTVLGARMMGGGFGGCTINLVEKAAADELIAGAAAAYAETFGTELTAYMVAIEDGVSIID